MVKVERNKFLVFFHSNISAISFKRGVQNKQGFNYVMGAYTFQAKPPFRITAISHYPILFDGIYNSPHMNTAESKKRIIFPSGFAFEKQDGRDLIHVSCGENDSAIKIVTLDQKTLLKSLKKI